VQESAILTIMTQDERQGIDMSVQVEMGQHETAVITAALINYVMGLNEQLAGFISLEGEGSGRTLDALSVKMTAVTMVRGLMLAAGAPDALVATVVHDLVEVE
jgi:hypothetical protein